jgi:hypothetical protein
MQEAIRVLLEAHAAEVRARRLRIRTELDESWQRPATGETIEAIRALLRLVFATIPDGCEIYVGSSRSTSPVARLDTGLLTVRWQVVGEGARLQTEEARVAPLRPRPGSAWHHVESPLARRAREAFARLGWCFDLEVLTSGHELVARASVDSKPAEGR